LVPPPAKRLTALPPYPFAVLNQRIREMVSEGVDVIRLDIGSPDMPPPEAVVDQLERTARRDDVHGYAGYKGTPDFRRAIAAYYLRRFNVILNPETEVLPLLGSKEGIVNLALAYLDESSLALVPDIGYPSYSLSAALAGGDVSWIPISDEEDHLIDPARIPPDVAARARLLWMNYPNNPTGATADLDFYQRMVDYCRAHDIILASDNPYVDVTFDGYVAPSALQAGGARDCVVEFISFSKTYNMAGWRLGAAVGNAEAIKQLLTVKSNMDSGHFQAIYDAGIKALETPQPWIDARNAVYAARRDRMLTVLPEIGLHTQPPKGSLYIWARAEHGDGGKYAQDALNFAHVALAPGAIYGPGGHDFVRLSVGMDDVRFDEALSRLKLWYASTT
jgi:LL-diaminopimelate aminotransferase